MRRQRLQSNVNIFGIVDMPIEINVAVPQGKRMSKQNRLRRAKTCRRILKDHPLLRPIRREQFFTDSRHSASCSIQQNKGGFRFKQQPVIGIRHNEITIHHGSRRFSTHPSGDFQHIGTGGQTVDFDPPFHQDPGNAALTACNHMVMNYIGMMTACCFQHLQHGFISKRTIVVKIADSRLGFFLK
nr:hypothetical protein [uncultured bacterium]